MLDIGPASTDAELELLIAVRRRVDPEVHPQLANLRHFLATTTVGAYFLARDEGEAVGCGFLGGPPGAEREHAIDAAVEVVPERRRRGVGSALLAAVSAHARGHGLTTLRLETKEDDEASIDFVVKRGFREAGRERAVVLDLASWDGAAAPPPGVEIVSWAERDDLWHGMHEVALDAVPDIPGEEEFAPSFEEWLAFETRPSRRRELCFAALADGEVVGYAATDAFGPKLHNGLTAVKRAWRRRGVATALKQAQFDAARRAGFTKLHTESEDRNVPMRSLNAKLGYEPAPGTIKFEGPLVG